MKLQVIIYAVLLIASQRFNVEGCRSRNYNYGGTVCVCNKDYCDTFEPIKQVEKSKFVKITSNKAGLRFQKEEGKFEKQCLKSRNVIKIGTKKYQEILGFGGAFTDATGINIKSINEELGNKIISSYFSDHGIEYSVGRVPMASTDFSLRGYSYCDTPNDTPDPHLENFKLQPEDFKYKIPFIHKALKLRKNKLDLLASAWIAPNWIRTIPRFTARGSYIKKDMFQLWADYYVKFLDSYKENNISFWGITTGNEPSMAFNPDNLTYSVAWTVDGLTKWITKNLGPTMKKSDYDDVNILILDDMDKYLPNVANKILSDKRANKFVDGVAIHWYDESIFTPKNLDTTHKLYPNKFILATEACNGFLPPKLPTLGNWTRGELYAEDILGDLNHRVIGWLDWNMVLNLQGGPTYLNNPVDSPIIINATAEEFYKQPMYYVLGHFSKFIPKGSIRIKSTTLGEVVSVAVTRPDGATAVVILNKHEKAVSITVRDARRGNINTDLTAKSLTSIIYW